MNPSAPILALCLCLAAQPATLAADLQVETLEADLASETFKVREQAEQTIRMAGIDQYDRVAKLAASPDPEVATRARRCLPVLLLDLDAHVPADLAGKLRRIDDFHGQDLEQIVAALASLDPQRPATLIGLHSHWVANPPEFAEANRQLLDAIERALQPALRGDRIPNDLSRIVPDRYEPATLAVVLNLLCRHHPEDLTPVLAVHEKWHARQPRFVEHLNRDGYRLEIEREARKAPNRQESLRKILVLATTNVLNGDQMAALRRQLATYREEAASFPVHTLDQAPGWFFFDAFGSDQGGTVHFEAYREFRRRYPDIQASILLGQPLEVLLVLEKSGVAAAFEYALAQNVHGGAILLGEWLHTRPELIREPIPLPKIKDGEEYPYRPVKFLRILAPYADDEELAKHPGIQAACAILAKDPGWQKVTRQARAAIAQQKSEAIGKQ